MMQRLKMKSLSSRLLLALMLGWSANGASAQVPAQPTPPPAAVRPPAAAEPATATGDEVPALKFESTPLDIVLQAYAAERGRTLLLAPNIPTATITLRSQQALSLDEYLLAIETVLGLHGVALIEVGEQFIKVVPAKDVRRLGIATGMPDPEAEPHSERGQMVSQMIELKHIDINEAQKVIDGFKRPDGQIQLFERTNSILVTDTADNVNRMREIIGYIDQPVVVREEANVRPIRFAKASEIKSRLDQIVAEAQKGQQPQATPREVPQARAAGAPGIVRVSAPVVPGVVRPRRPDLPSEVPEPEFDTIISTLVEEAERGVIRGKVHIVADDRTNVLIIITRPENMTFFDRIISVLDIETAPDVLVEVMRLEYADSEEVAKMLNDLIATSRDRTGAAGAAAEGLATTEDSDARSARLAEFVERLSREPGIDDPGVTKAGQLSSDNINILANKRTNALVIMASASDMAALRAIIKDMDIMLSQVLIETVILEITLDDNLETGVEWVQRAMIGYSSSREAQLAFAGRGGASSLRPLDPLTLNRTDAFPSSSGIAYYLSYFGLNLDAVIHASKTDSRTRILNSPVILTQDNKEATIEATTRQYFYRGKKYVGGGTADPVYEDDVEQRDVGLTLKVTPRINERGFVVMSIEQNVENISGTQTINEADWPIVTSRRVGADIAVSNGETVLLGGLVLNSQRNSKNKIPILGSIPVLGWLFRSTRIQDARSEVVVFLTPYVLDSPVELYEDALRRRNALEIGDMWQRGWSDSRLADPVEPHPLYQPAESNAATPDTTEFDPLADEVRRAFGR